MTTQPVSTTNHVANTFYKPALRNTNMAALKPSTETIMLELEEVLIVRLDSESIQQYEATNLIALAQYCCIH